MPKQVQLRRGTTSDHTGFTGAEGELTIDTSKDTAVVHDGTTAGGHPLAKASEVLPSGGGTMSGAIAMGGNAITGLSNPGNAQDAVTKTYADTMLPKAGGTMSGAIAMGGSKVTGVGSPTSSADAATKGYVDSTVAGEDSLAELNDTSIASPAGGQVLRHDGTDWKNATIAAGDLPSGIDASRLADGTVSDTEFQRLNGVTGAIQTQLDATDNLQGRTVASTAPGDGQALKWNNAGSQWEPGDVSGGGGSATDFTWTRINYSSVSSNTSYVEFTSGIYGNDYKVVWLVFHSVALNGTSRKVYVRLGTSSGLNTSSYTYRWHTKNYYTGSTGHSADIQNGNGGQGNSYIQITDYVGVSSTAQTHGVVDGNFWLHEPDRDHAYGSTSKYWNYFYNSVHANSVSSSTNAVGYYNDGGGFAISSSAQGLAPVARIRIYPSSGYFTSGDFYLYGGK